jgi:hypothetical protein
MTNILEMLPRALVTRISMISLQFLDTDKRSPLRNLQPNERRIVFNVLVRLFARTIAAFDDELIVVANIYITALCYPVCLSTQSFFSFELSLFVQSGSVPFLSDDFVSSNPSRMARVPLFRNCLRADCGQVYRYVPDIYLI